MRVLLTVLLALPLGSAAAQDPDRTFRPPIGGTWEPVQSLGQPPRWKPYVGLGFGIDRSQEEHQSGPTGTVGMYRDLTSPVYGLLGASAELYGGQRGEELDGGVRGYFDSRLFFLSAGIDWNARLNRRDFVLSFTFPTTRGGWLGRGGELRVDWLPGRNHSLIGSASFPIAQPLAGKTRPKQVSVPLPRPPKVTPAPRPAARTPLGGALAELDRSALWVTRLHNLFWLASDQGRLYDKSPDRARAALAAFRTELRRRDSLVPERNTYAREVEFYHRLLERSFGMAAGASGEAAIARGRPIADVAASHWTSSSCPTTASSANTSSPTCWAAWWRGGGPGSSPGSSWTRRWTPDRAGMRWARSTPG